MTDSLFEARRHELARAMNAALLASHYEPGPPGVRVISREQWDRLYLAVRDNVEASAGSPEAVIAARRLRDLEKAVETS